LREIAPVVPGIKEEGLPIEVFMALLSVVDAESFINKF
jgi:hypothetical protein